MAFYYYYYLFICILTLCFSKVLYFNIIRPLGSDIGDLNTHEIYAWTFLENKNFRNLTLRVLQLARFGRVKAWMLKKNLLWMFFELHFYTKNLNAPKFKCCSIGTWTLIRFTLERPWKTEICRNLLRLERISRAKAWMLPKT